MSASVVIVTYNRADIIGRCLDSLKTQTIRPLEIIVVDSSDNEETRRIVKKYRNVKYYHTGKRISQPAARNAALKLCKSDILAFIDDDAIASENWLMGITEGYGNEKIAGVCGPAISTNENLVIQESIIKSENNLNRFTFTGDVLSESRRWIPPHSVECTVMLGANMSFLRKKLLEVGGFDEFYGRHAAFREETDPQIALVKRGFIFLYNPKAVIWHMMCKKGGVRSNPRKDYYYWCGVNHRYMIDKYKFSKFWSRLSWLTFSRNPPSLPIGLFLAVVRRDTGILKWYRGLFGKEKR